MILVDDYGYANIGYHAPDPSTKEVQTPNLDALARAGVKLERFYAFKICSPSRSSLQSGRLPVHVNTVNLHPEAYNAKDPISGYAGIPTNMTGFAVKLKRAGYRTYMTGKWDAGMATPYHLPRYRGYDEALFYFHHANDYWNYKLELTATAEASPCPLADPVDLFHNLKGAGPEYAHSGKYEEDLFLNHSLRVIDYHATRVGSSTPMFLFHSFHLIHSPLQVPKEDEALFSFISHPKRRLYAAMVHKMDVIVGKLVESLKAHGMYDETLIVFCSDNGGPIYDPGSANNFPLRAGKYSDFEGGVRVNAFLSGGFVPSENRGETSQDLIHITDIYATLVYLANGRPSGGDFAALLKDEAAEHAGLPPVDSINFWPTLFGSKGNPEKRVEIHLSDQALISGKYKIVVGVQHMDIWQGPSYPNATGRQPCQEVECPFVPGLDFKSDCGADGCLFDVFADPTEHEDIASKLPDVRASLLARLADLNRGNFNPDRGNRPSKRACAAAKFIYKGAYGPFLHLDAMRSLRTTTEEGEVSATAVVA